MKGIKEARALWKSDQDQEAINILVELDLENDGEANFLMGTIYINAEKGFSNIKRNVKKGKKHLKKALKLGIADAGEELADLYYFGNGVKEDHDLAKKYWKKSVKLGSALAAFELANFYYNSESPKKVKKAIDLYLWLISKNEFVGNSCFKLSKIYKLGMGVPTDPVQSFEFLEKGADHNHTNCCMELALKYYRGNGIYSPNPEKALELAGRVGEDDLFYKEVAILIQKMKLGEKL